MKKLLFFLCILSLGCEPELLPDSFRIKILVRDDEEMAVANAIVQIDQRKIPTDNNGIASLEIEANEGATGTVTVRCPKKMKPIPSDTQKLVLRKIHGSDNTTELAFVCASTYKEHVLIVKTNQYNLPVQLNGKTVSHTDADGFAQMMLSGKADENVHLRINTENHPLLLPKNPSLIVSLPPRRKFLFFEQDFEHVEPMKSTRKKRRRLRTGPKRL